MKGWSKLTYNRLLDVESYHAFCIKHGFPRHMHEHYVICLIENGFQTFTHRKRKHLTPLDGLVFLNPGDDHTGEPADSQGFEYRAFYPKTEHMMDAAYELTGKRNVIPFFRNVRFDNPELSGNIRALCHSLSGNGEKMEQESLFLSVLTAAISRYADI